MKHLDYAKREQDIAGMVESMSLDALRHATRSRVYGQDGVKNTKEELAGLYWNIKHAGLYRSTRPRCWSIIA